MLVGQNIGGAFFKGSIDEVMIFNKPLSLSEVRAIYYNQK